MVDELTSLDGLEAYKAVLDRFGSDRTKHNHNYEIQDLILQIGAALGATARLRSFLDFLFEKEPLRLGKGLRKAERAYVRTGDRITKPSYMRIPALRTLERRRHNQVILTMSRLVARRFCEEPNASYHVISIFRPVDLLDKFRPGYVPCVVCADFKYRKNKLSGKFFFRSCDAYNLLPFDMFYCIGIMENRTPRGIIFLVRSKSVAFYFGSVASTLAVSTSSSGPR